MKPAITKVLQRLLAPIQKEFEASSEWQEVPSHPPPYSSIHPLSIPNLTNFFSPSQIEKAAYPPPPVEEKKKKVKKDKGSRHPGAAKKGSEEQADQGKAPAEASATDVGSAAAEALEKLNVDGGTAA